MTKKKYKELPDPDEIEFEKDEFMKDTIAILKDRKVAIDGRWIRHQASAEIKARRKGIGFYVVTDLRVFTRELVYVHLKKKKIVWRVSVFFTEKNLGPRFRKFLAVAKFIRGE